MDPIERLRTLPALDGADHAAGATISDEEALT